MSSFRFAHLSDLHFSAISFGLSQFFSKRWVGNFNLILRRGKDFDHAMLDYLIPILQQEKVDFVLISGDLTSSSLDKEFKQARAFIQKIQKVGIPVLLLPGNHDHYTKKAFKKKIFYHFFPSDKNNPALFTLEKHRIALKNLPHSWQLILMDSTLATSLFSCHGTFSEELEANLKAVLDSLPSDAKVILANHFPIALENNFSLKREEALLTLLHQYPKVKLYLHGHSHQRRIHHTQELPILSDAGSASHKHRGSWNLIECGDNRTSIQPYVWVHKQWVPEEKKQFTWES